MNRLLQSALLFAVASLLLGLAPEDVTAQTRKDTVNLIQSPGSRPYQCCYTFVVGSRQRRGSTISEFNIRIASGRGQFLASQATAPNEWTVFPAQDLKSVSWFATSQGSEIDSGESLTGFTICAADTGVMRIVWETRTVDTVFSRDTIVVACRGIECDEAFVRQLPSDVVCAFEVDLVGGNRRGVPINELRLRNLTPGVSFVTTMTGQPTGWNRTRNTADSIVFLTFSNYLDFGEILEGFRFQSDAPRDSTFRILWSMYSYEEHVCTDTATIVCKALRASDSVRVIRRSDSCCESLSVLNAHAPTSAIGRIALKVLTPSVRISTPPPAPTGWTRTISAAGDSVSYSTTRGLDTRDSAVLAGLCFDNTRATTDTVRYRWETFSAGIPVDAGELTRLCLRPLTRCDSVTARVDSTEGTTQRCISVVLRNFNSRSADIERIVLRISNPGVRRRILNASAPIGWTVAASGADSVVFAGTQLAPGDSDRFEICVSIDDPGMQDPLTIAWQTESATGPLCAGSLNVFARIVILCDTLSAEERPTFEPTWCCYSVAFTNANSRGRTIDGIQLEVGSTSFVFSDASGNGSWYVADSTFPAIRVGYTGGRLAPGDTTERFTFCIDARQFPDRPITLPVIWRTYASGSVVCTGTVTLGCAGQPGVECDTALLISTDRPDGACSYEFAVANLHTPASTVNQVRFHLVEGDGRFRRGYTSGQAMGFNQVIVRPDTVTFLGDSIQSRDTVGSFFVEIGQTEGGRVKFEVCTYNGDQSICCDIVEANCGTTGLTLPLVPTGFRIASISPNPLTDATDVVVDVVRPGPVEYVLRDDRGAELRRVSQGFLGAGQHRFSVDAAGLSGGLYFLSIGVGSERTTQRIVVVR